MSESEAKRREEVIRRKVERDMKELRQLGEEIGYETYRLYHNDCVTGYKPSFSAIGA